MKRRSILSRLLDLPCPLCAFPEGEHVVTMTVRCVPQGSTRTTDSMTMRDFIGEDDDATH